MRSSQNEVFEYDQASTNRKLCSARGSLSFLSVWPWWPGSATGVQTSHNSFSEIVSSGGIFTLLTHPLCYIKPHKLSRGKNSLRRVNSTCMSVMELVWCGQVIEASCSRYRSTACIPLITKMLWVCACVQHAYMHSTHIYMWVLYVGVCVCDHCGLQDGVCWKGFPACIFHWGAPNTRFHLAELFHWPQRTSELQQTVKTTSSPGFILKSSGRQWAPLGSSWLKINQKYFSTCVRGAEGFRLFFQTV